MCFSDQAEARRTKVKEARKRREERIAVKRAEMLKSYAKDDEIASQKKQTVYNKNLNQIQCVVIDKAQLLGEGLYGLIFTQGTQYRQH